MRCRENDVPVLWNWHIIYPRFHLCNGCDLFIGRVCAIQNVLKNVRGAISCSAILIMHDLCQMVRVGGQMMENDWEQIFWMVS